MYISQVYTDIVKNHSIELVNQKWLLLKIVWIYWLDLLIPLFDKQTKINLKLIGENDKKNLTWDKSIMFYYTYFLIQQKIKV